ncbi:MAG TPA: hypothetical protein VFI31_16935 [Pirellulales bacterium]|nr:hypothetical protein [Pirellulales bacterium]
MSVSSVAFVAAAGEPDVSRNGGTHAVSADDETPETRRADRLETMREIVGGIKLESGEGDDRAALELSPEPLLRYSDPPHESLEDATVWIWRRGERPAAMLKLEFYPRLDRGPTWSFCWTSLSGRPLDGQMEGGRSWTSRPADIAPQWLLDAPPPADDADGRLRQMRQLARRFTAYRIYGEHGRTELRLLSRPVYRYKSQVEGITDGAVFSVMKDTNPHVELLIESALDGDAPRWRFACVRHADAECHLLLDGREVWQAEMRAEIDPRRPYFWFQRPASDTRRVGQASGTSNGPP